MPADLAVEVMYNLLVGRTRDEIDSLFARLAEPMQHPTLETPSFMNRDPSAQEFMRGGHADASAIASDATGKLPEAELPTRSYGGLTMEYH